MLLRQCAQKTHQYGSLLGSPHGTLRKLPARRSRLGNAILWKQIFFLPTGKPGSIGRKPHQIDGSVANTCDYLIVNCGLSGKNSPQTTSPADSTLQKRKNKPRRPDTKMLSRKEICVQHLHFNPHVMLVLGLLWRHKPV